MNKEFLKSLILHIKELEMSKFYHDNLYAHFDIFRDMDKSQILIKLENELGKCNMNNKDWDEAIERESIMAKEECKKEIEFEERIQKAISKGIERERAIQKAISKGIKRERAIQMHKQMFGCDP